MKLLVAALEIELDAFPDHMPGYERLVTGAGKLKATFELTRALTSGNFTEIVIVGTAGSIDPEAASGVHEIAHAIQHDVYDLQGTRGSHLALDQTVSTGRPGVTIATGDFFVQDADEVAEIRALGASLVDMETFAYIWVAQRMGIPVRAARAVSDSASDGAILTFRERVALCSAELWEWFQAECLTA